MKTANSLDAKFFALSDPIRRDILRRLGAGEATVQELSTYGTTIPAICKHLRILENAGLILRRQEAQFRPRRLADGAFQFINDWAHSQVG